MTDRILDPGATLSLAYVLTRPDLEAFFGHVACRPETLRRPRRCVIAAAAVAPVLMIAIGAGLEGKRFDLARWLLEPLVILSVPFFLSWLLVLRPLQRWGARLAVGRQLRGIAPGLILGRMRLDVSPDGLLLVKPGGEARFAWPSVTGVEDAPGHVFIMLGKLLAIVVPTRDIAPREVAILRDLVLRHMAGLAPAPPEGTPTKP